MEQKYHKVARLREVFIVQKLLSFLKRRHGYSLIEFGKLDEAEKVFKSLLDDPTSQDYAVSELAYIQKLKPNDSPES